MNRKQHRAADAIQLGLCPGCNCAAIIRHLAAREVQNADGEPVLYYQADDGNTVIIDLGPLHIISTLEPNRIDVSWCGETVFSQAAGNVEHIEVHDGWSIALAAIRSALAAGAKSANEIAAVLNARGIRTARGGE